MSKLKSALALAAQGFAVFPLVINGKVPAIDGNWRVVATTDPDKIARLWSDPVFGSEIDYNVGVALDSKTLVVDVDTRNDKRGAQSLVTLEAINDPLPPTHEVVTASGGRHLYYKVPDSGVFPKELATHIDLKGEGGYVVGPGSTIDGRSYEARGEGGRSGIADAPSWVRDLGNANRPSARDRVAPGTEITELDTPNAVARATEWLTNSAPDHGTFKVACRVKDFGISEATALELMTEHWPGADAREYDHIEFRVQNAYRYGTSPAGVSNPEAEFDAVEPSPDKPKAPPRGLYAVRFADAIPDLDRPYLIDDMMDLGAMVVTYGDSNAGKTYVVLDQCISIAASSPWNGHKVQGGLVVYVAAEGGRGFMKRVEAYKRDKGYKDLPLSIVPCPIDLHSSGETGDTNRLIRLIRAEEAFFGQKCVLVVVDTLARAMGGGDENTAVDMGLLVGHCDRLRAALGATVNVIHHTGKDKAKGARGSSALRAATDTEIEVSPGLLAVQKQRDMAKTDEMHFELREVGIGQRADGKTATACVVDWIAASEFDVRISPDAEAMFERFVELIEAAREKRNEVGEGSISVEWADWKMSCKAGFAHAKGKVCSDQYLYKVRRELQTSGLVAQNKQKQWVMGQTNPTNQNQTESAPGSAE